MNAAPLGVGELGDVTSASWVAAAALTVALNVTGLPVAPAKVAVTVAVPATVGSVQELIVATPFEFVVAVNDEAGGEPTPFRVIVPPLTVNVTFTPATGF